MAEINILLAAYNGTPFLRQQIDSILRQSYPHFHLILSDDGSDDGTPELLERYAREYPDRITHYRSGQRFGSAQAHFMHLLHQFHDAPYIMFSDQDDVWHPDKVEKTLLKMQSLDTGAPALVHTDLRVVDRQLRELSPSFCRLSNLDGSRTGLNQLLIQNVVTGCTVMLNRPLAVLACESTAADALLVHDWWLAILASAVGTIGFLPEPTIDYRQHGSNSVGAKNTRSPAYLWKRFTARDTRQVMTGAARQAAFFLNCYRNHLQPGQIAMLTDFAGTANAPWFSRIRTYRKYRIWKYGLLRVAAQILGG